MSTEQKFKIEIKTNNDKENIKPNQIVKKEAKVLREFKITKKDQLDFFRRLPLNRSQKAELIKYFQNRNKI